MDLLARWCHQHRRLVLVFWLVGIFAVFGLGQAVKPHYRAGDLLPGTGSRQAADVLAAGFPAQAGDEDIIVISVASGSVRDADVQAPMTAMLAQVAALPHVRGVQSPYTPDGAADVSTDGRAAYANVTFDQPVDTLPTSAVKKVVDTATAAGGARIHVNAGGNAVSQATMTVDTTVSEIVGVLAAMLILLFAFRSLVSATLPLISALVSLLPSIALIGMVSRALVVPSFASSLTILLNLGVGIDYALFLVTRQRRGLLEGQTPQDAIVSTMRTAGRSVLYAGLVVCLALLSLMGMGIGYLSGMGAAAAIGIAFTALAALTLTPALLGFFGEKVFSRRERHRMAQGIPPLDVTSPGWARWSKQVMARPAAFAGLSALIIVVLALPVFSIRLGASDQGNDPTSSTTRRAYDDLAAGFGPGFNGPLFIVVQGASAPSAATAVASAVATTPGVASVRPPQLAPSGQVGLIEAFPAAAPQAQATVDLVGKLRGSVLPRAVAGTGAAVYVGGFTATQIDFTHAVGTKLPIFIVIVALFGAVLVTVAFRSLFIAALTAVMNLLAVGVCFGIITAIFNWGWFGSLLGLGRPGPIDAFLPVFLFSILFGLSMDYQVFLIGRIHDGWHRTGQARQAVVAGQTETGRVITAAAGVMVLVFLSFATGNRLETLFGLGLGATVLLDAFVIRTMLVPAILHLAGERAWWAPRWLRRTPPRTRPENDHEPEGVYQ
jgi:RND superfamily putative drug exporter